jgi:hypothetical protein
MVHLLRTMTNKKVEIDPRSPDAIDTDENGQPTLGGMKQLIRILKDKPTPFSGWGPKVLL